MSIYGYCKERIFLPIYYRLGTFNKTIRNSVITTDNTLKPMAKEKEQKNK